MSRTSLVIMLALGALITLMAYRQLPDQGWPPRPRGFPRFAVPADNPVTREAAALGRALFHDRRLAFNGAIACADCHQQRHGFADPRPLSLGATGETTRRNAMSLTNVAYNGRLTWADDRLATLEAQALVPLTLEHPLEMGFARDPSGILARLRADERLRRQFEAAFPADTDPVTLPNIARALASFERLLTSGDSAYDRFLAGDRDALSPSAQQGLALFRAKRLNCLACHDGFNFRLTPGHRRDENDLTVAYHNTGLYNLDGKGAYPPADRGLMEVTGNPADMGRFKAPTLRNIAVTAPYMHDGSIATLDAVLDHYARGGRLIDDGALAGDGSRSPLKSALVTGFTLSAAEKRDVIAFLESLTDQAFLTNPDFGPPTAAQ